MAGTLNFEFTGDQPDGQVVIDLRGEVDVYSAPRLRDELQRLLSEGRTDILLDVERLEFVDSTGLGVIVAIAKQASDAGGRLTLRAPPEAVQHVLHTTGLEGLVTVTE